MPNCDSPQNKLSGVFYLPIQNMGVVKLQQYMDDEGCMWLGGSQLCCKAYATTLGCCLTPAMAQGFMSRVPAGCVVTSSSFSLLRHQVHDLCWAHESITEWLLQPRAGSPHQMTRNSGSFLCNWSGKTTQQSQWVLAWVMERFWYPEDVTFLKLFLLSMFLSWLWSRELSSQPCLLSKTGLKHPVLGKLNGQVWTSEPCKNFHCWCCCFLLQALQLSADWKLHSLNHG